jgi:PKD repeat protein
MKLLSLLIFFSLATVFGQVSFTVSNSTPCIGENVVFTNTSTIGITYNWNMGDGTVYSGQTNANHSYSQGGGYWVILNAYDGVGAFIGNSQVYINVVGPPSTITMPDVACPNDQLDLNAYMTNAVSWSWDFGDGTTASGSDYVQHTYTSTGTYYPQVTITSSCGTYLVQDTIIITNSLPNFTYYTNLWVDPDSVCPGTTIYGQSIDGFSAYSWDYGDGNTASGNYYVNWSYASNGTYTVTHTVTNGCGVDTVMTDVVVVSNTTPVQNPQIDLPDTICPNEQFYAGSWSGDGITYDWDMDDGSPIISDNGGINYTYTTIGTYIVQVTITNDCSNQITLSDTIVVDPNAQVINPYFGISQTVACPGDPIDFWSNYDYSFYIDFGDGTGSSSDATHTYSTPGTYVVSSTIQNACGNSVVLSDTILIQNNLPIPPNSVFVYIYPDPACPTDIVELDASPGFINYDWDFGDGSTGTGQQVDHIFNASGNYNASVTVTNGCGAQETVIFAVQIQDNLPVDNINLDIWTDTACVGDVVFVQNDGGNNGGYDFAWDMGDGSTYSTVGVTHTYSAIGTYIITLTVTNGCGVDSTVIDSVVVSNNYTPDPSNINVFVTAEGCVGDEVIFVFIPAGLGAITWDFGDGTSSSVVNPVFVQGLANVDVTTHGYSAPGTYWATYTLTNSCGNTVTDSVQVTIGSAGTVFNIGVDMLMNESQTVCQETPVEFMAIGAGTYIWDFGDGSGQLVTYASLSPVYHTYTDAGSYTVTLEGIDACGNTDNSDEQLVIPPSKINVSTNTVTEPNCGQNNGLAVVSASGGIAPYQFSWTNGDQGVIADSLQSGIYVVSVSDINGCTNEGIATVSDEEGVTILLDNVVNVDCYGNDNGSISVSLLGGQPPYTILWSNGDQTEDIFGLQAGPYEIFITDANGCFAVESFIVAQPAKSNISVITQAATCGSNNGSAVANINNGTPPYNYLWPNASGPSNQTGGLTPGVQTLLVIDGNTCLLEKDFSINETGAPIIINDSIVTGTCNGTLSSIYISTIGGTAPFTYNWSNASTSQDLSGVVPGEYTIQITGTGGCSSYANYMVEETLPAQTSICLVTVDTLTQTNIVVWDPVTAAGIESYNIYKESSEAGLYYLVGNQTADSVSQYYDYLSDPSIRSWRYKVAAIDDCGNEAEWSGEHKTIHLTTNVGISGEVNLIWDHYEGFAYPTYYINRYHPLTGWEILDSLASNLISYTDQSPPGDSSLIYMVSINPPSTCTSSKAATDYNSSRSNSESINAPEPDNSSIEEASIDLTIYPNPTNGIVQIRYEGIINEVRLFDMSGKLIYTNSVVSNIMVIDMSVFERGVYSVQLYTENGLINGKIIRD